MKPSNTPCPNCATTGLSIFYEIEEVPVHSVLLMRDRQTALNFSTGDIRLGFCSRCGFISNTAFNPDLLSYSSEYEATQGYSSTFNSFHRQLALQLVQQFDLQHKKVIEIGCGNGEFLALLTEMGAAEGIGFDPAYNEGRHPVASSAKLTFIKDYYSENYKNYQADFVCCKMTLEHIRETGKFVDMVRRCIGDRPDTVVFFQVPDIQRILSEQAFWDIYYEHCSYFSRESLGHLFQESGFRILNLYSGYDNQYLMIEAIPEEPGKASSAPYPANLQKLTELVELFFTTQQKRLVKWRNRLNEMKQAGKKNGDLGFRVQRRRLFNHPESPG